MFVPCTTFATWLLSVKILGLEICLTIPNFSSAVISALITAELVLLISPIPLVAPVAPKFVILSVAEPNAAEVAPNVADEVPSAPPAASEALFE